MAGKQKKPRKGRSDKGRARVADAERRVVQGYSLPPRFIAALVGAAQARSAATSQPISASAVLSGILAGHVDELEQEARA